MTSPQFSHAPLDRVERDIRLIRYDPIASDGQDLTYNLESWDIEECPPFHALSYVWGVDMPTKRISLDGKPFLVRDNLSAVLHALPRCRISDEITHLWADAICINQEDLKEKEHQINLMGEIYSRAMCVIAWLGPAADGSDLAMERLEDLGRTQQRTSILPEYHDDVCADSNMDALIKRVYFVRAWTVQEFILANDLRIMCGAHILPWSYFEPIWDANGLMRAKRAPRRSSLNVISRGLPLPFPLGPSGCHEPKDRIYALLGLAQSYHHSLGSLKADYEVNNRGLFFRVIHHVRDAGHNFKTLIPWWQTFDLFIVAVTTALELPMDLWKQCLLMHQLIIASRCLDLYNESRLAEDIEDVRDRFIFLGNALFDVLHKIVGYLKLKAPFNVKEAYEFLIPSFGFYVVSEDPTGWRAFQIALWNALVHLNYSSKTDESMRSILLQWRRIDQENEEHCWQVGNEELLKSRIHERYRDFRTVGA